MSDSSITWREPFTQLFHAGVERYRAGHHLAAGIVDEKGRAFLESIGYTEQEFFDFVEDFAKGGEPTLEDALAIAAVRRDYFFEVQAGRRSLQVIPMSDLPAKDAEADGIPWLPRLLAKAETKLRGEMPPDLMYGCGGDRKFFRTHQIAPSDFLREVWRANGRHAAVIDWVKQHGAA